MNFLIFSKFWDTPLAYLRRLLIKYIIIDRVAKRDNNNNIIDK